MLQAKFVKIDNIAEIKSLQQFAMESMTSKLVEVQEKWMQNILLNDVLPPVKLPITKGKLKWRGISLLHVTDGGMFILQRGQVVGTGLKIEPVFKLN